MIISEKKVRELIFKNAGNIWPAAAFFFLCFVFRGSEWLIAISLLALALLFLRYGLDGRKLVASGILLMLIAGYSNDNPLAVASYWMVLAGVVVLSINLFKSWSNARSADK